MTKITIFTESVRLEIDGARGVSAGEDRRVVVHAAGREITVELPPTAAVTYLTDNKVLRA